MKHFLKNEDGDTNIVPLVILLVLIISASLIFRPYIIKLVEWLISLFS